MCAIFSANSKKEFRDLYELNRTRGDFSYGGMYIWNDKRFVIDKQKGEALSSNIPDDADLYIGHTRAPTATTGQFNWNNTHPFIYGDHIVAHNGIISNCIELAFYKKIEVDSELIPFTLQASTQGYADGLQKLRGTFAIWDYNIRHEELIIARSANPIWLHPDTNSFSSIEFPESFLIEEGKVYLLSQPFEIIETFSYTSPYFIP